MCGVHGHLTGWFIKIKSATKDTCHLRITPFSENFLCIEERIAGRNKHGPSFFNLFLETGTKGCGSMISFGLKSFETKLKP